MKYNRVLAHYSLELHNVLYYIFIMKQFHLVSSFSMLYIRDEYKKRNKMQLFTRSLQWCDCYDFSGDVYGVLKRCGCGDWSAQGCE